MERIMTEHWNSLKDEIEEIANLGSFELNLETMMVSASERFFLLFGISNKQEISVDELKSFIHPDDLESVISAYKDALKNQFRLNIRFRIKTGNGVFRYLLNRTKIVKINGLARIHGVVQDITKIKLDAEKLEDAVELSKVKNNALSHVAHDLRTPLGNIMGLLTDDANEYQKELLGYIDEACQTALSTVTDLIELSRIEEGRYQIRKEKVLINDLINNELRSSILKIEHKHLNIISNLQHNLLADIHPRKFSRVIANLLSNAIKFSYEGGDIEIYSYKDENSIVIKIKDYGVGISEKRQQFLFDRFSPVGMTGTSGEESVGLGLYIVRHMVELHNGQISVESKEGQGSTFIIKLPLIE
ncbi:MAG: PAS domain-containing sensor histidine kinase [Bacteroidales bacterium]|nr:PAS domain-containing sensor histidine kinase [Bacteroidales bacterium]